MPIPPYGHLMLPVLRLSAQQQWQMKDLIEEISNSLNLTLDERAETLPSGGTTIIGSRVQWAKTYLKQAGLIDQPKRAVIAATQIGFDLLNTNPTKIDLTTLRNYPEFLAFQQKTNKSTEPTSLEKSQTTDSADQTPDDQIETAAKILDQVLRQSLLDTILQVSPAFFERLIIDLLIAMGYGGSRADAARQIGGTGDGGVDGVIDEDQLGLDRVYLQAKRYQPGNNVGGPVVQAFIGALVTKGAQKGVIITTSSFSKSARDASAASGNYRIILIDGDELSRLMIRFNVGVRVSKRIEIKKVDQDYFDDSE